MPLPVPVGQLKKELVGEGIVDEEKFDKLAEEAERKNQNLADILVSEKVVEASYLNGVLARLLGVELANLNVRRIDEQVLRLIPEEVARERQVIVFAREPDGTFDVAMADPSDLETISFLTQQLQGKVKPFLATQSDLNVGFAIYGMRSTEDFKRIIEEQIQASLASETKTIEEAAALLPIVAIVDNLLSYAMARRASDIHLEILEQETLVRYRIDGILQEIMRMPKAIHPALVARIKLLAGLKLDEHHKPQDGRFRYKIVNQVVDVRVSVLPTFYGEKVVMRLLETTQKPLSLEELGLMAEDAEVVARNLEHSFGMILVCGPTGSGKTTTLYAFMNILNRPEVNIVTTEDPIEYNMRYINQTQINPQAGITFANSLRSILRQDPDIIMVGEIRDRETANIAVQAALTGHLLLSSLHTNDAPTTIPRLFDLGVPPFLVASTLNLVVAQRLVRRICTTCVYSYKVSDDLKEIVQEQLHRLNIEIGNIRIPPVLYRGRGCEACGMTGYRGRVGIFEVLEVTEKIRSIITAPKFDLGELRNAAKEAGMKSMFEDGLRKAELAITTLEEVLRVIKE